ncbi:MAG: CGLD27 family protein [Leptolyngbya sp. SIO4C1]|nr:CGLD27 family protein [Leptolyngbya sp. SIO4C1]
MKTTASRCPVPADQVPIREYEEMRESWFYSWGTQETRRYLRQVFTLWLVSWLVAGPVAVVSFPLPKHWLQFLISAALGGLVLPSLALLQLYIGWSHVGNRLRNQAVPYEESGWYDGQVWVKPEDVSNRDRLIVDYQIVPILKRLRKTFAAMIGLVLSGGLLWQFL